MSNDDLTQQQTEGGRFASKKLSMQATAPPADVPGYRLERFLGSGAFGQVWVGRDLNTGRPVAVKFFLHRGGVNWSLLSHEVKNLVQLSADRNIVQVLEVGWDSDPPFYVMELVTGGSLEDELTERGAMPVGEAVELFRKICVGLNHSHSKGVLHCDLKPANILLGEDNEPRLADFGQSRMTHDQTPALGTLFYMAPEQANLESSPSSAWDVYAAGAILYRMLTGEPPYRDETIIEQLDTAGSLPKRLKRYRDAIRKAPPPVHHVKQQGVDRDLARIVSHCLAVNPDDRFTNVQEILDQLDRRAESQARRPLLLLGILGPILLLIATGFFASRTIDRAVASTQDALRKEGAESNSIAARFAARTLESELEKYFRLCREETEREDFREALSKALLTPEVRAELTTIASSEPSVEGTQKIDARERLLDVENRQVLDEFLKSRLSNYVSTDKRNVPQLASMFVTDDLGTIFAIAYDAPITRDQSSAGRNYAYRTYFHGGKKDLDRGTSPASITPLSRMHLSAAFQSTATGLWKVAISVPLRLSESSDRVDAVFVVTINLGDFELLSGEAGRNKIAVLLDSREGPTRGTVLQHPYLEQQHRAGANTVGQVFRWGKKQMDALVDGGDDTYEDTYEDPVSKAVGGEDFAGEWLAAMQTVSVPLENSISKSDLLGRPTDNPLAGDADSAENRADLLVLVQYRLRSVFEPVAEMKRTLLLEGIWAVVSFVLVSGTLWFLVRRIGKDSKPELTRGGASNSRSTVLPDDASPPERPSARSGSPSATPPARTGMTETIEAPDVTPEKETQAKG
ncbi:MAG: protein kinase [Planctomycetota bacterium]